jgi:hypothetical protein
MLRCADERPVRLAGGVDPEELSLKCRWSPVEERCEHHEMLPHVERGLVIREPEHIPHDHPMRLSAPKVSLRGTGSNQ